MNFKKIIQVFVPLLGIELIFMIPAMIWAMIDHDVHVQIAFIKTMIVIAVVGILFWLVSRDAEDGFYAREGLVTTGMAWIIMSILGCLPFYFSHEIPSFIDALFETVSGFTTTGSSILVDVEEMSRGLLYWRSFTHWLGGMGVLVFLLAIVPLSGKNEGFTLHILRAESPGPSVGKLVPRMRQTAIILYVLYFVLTVIDIILLMVGGMSLFEALCTGFGTAGTGGFGVKSDSLASYSPFIQNVTTIFMFLFGVNFSCYYLIFINRIKDALKDEELHAYLGIIFVSILVITLNIRPLYQTTEESLRHAAFQVGTVMSTTGYATTDFDLWPGLSKGILMILMLGGACAGSTGGGFKIARVVLLLKSLRRNIHENLHPSEIKKIRMNGHIVDEKVLANLNGYLAAYVGIMVISFLLISIDGFSIETNVSAVIATLNNIGPGFAEVGATCNYSMYSAFSKCVLIFNMLAGRLELFPMIILFARTTWTRK